MTITPAASAENISIARTLFLEYAEWLAIDLCYQNFDRELAEFTRSVRPRVGVISVTDVIKLVGDLAGVGIERRSTDQTRRPRVHERAASASER
jgi:hypothetical protein